MRAIVKRFVLLAFLGSLAVTSPQDEAGFVPLFNGRDLTGWTNVNCAPTTWAGRDGVIHCTGTPICELRTDRMYENFVLELEYQHLDPKGNAGVFIWGDAITATGQPFVRAIEVQVLDGRNTENYTSHGDVFAIHGAKMTPDRPHPGGWMRSLPSERRARPAGEWNHYRITALNGTVKLAVNGKDVSGGYDISPRKGYIHLESEGGRILFRNVRLKALPSSPTLPPELVGNADEGFVSIYSGVDFAGWQHRATHGTHWASKDWNIAYDGGGEADARVLTTEKTFGDVSFLADWRWTNTKEGKTVPVWIEGVSLTDAARAELARALSARPPASTANGWRRAIVTRRGGRVSLVVDGQLVLENLPAGSGGTSRLLLRPEEGAAEFGSLFVKQY